MKIFVGIAFVGLGLVACASEKPFDPSGVNVAVDSAVYHLQPQPGHYWYQINLTLTLVNNKNYDVFVSKDCGSWRLARADESDKTYLYLGSYGCIESPRQAPLDLAPGQRFSRSFTLAGSNSPDTRPPITIENNTGTLVFEYVLTDPDGRPAGRARSAPFRVEPPG